MTRPIFGSDAPAVPVFGSAGARSHRCIAALGFDCPGPAPHDPPAKADPSTVLAFPDLEQTPSVWTPREEDEA